MLKKLLLLLIPLFLSCTEEPIPTPTPSIIPTTYTQSWFKDSSTYGTRQYILTTDRNFRFLQYDGISNKLRVDMNGWYNNINDSVVKFNWRTIRDVTVHKYWEDTIYYTTYGIFLNNDSIMKVVHNNGTLVHPYGDVFVRE